MFKLIKLNLLFRFTDTKSDKGPKRIFDLIVSYLYLIDGKVDICIGAKNHSDLMRKIYPDKNLMEAFLDLVFCIHKFLQLTRTVTL